MCGRQYLHNVSVLCVSCKEHIKSDQMSGGVLVLSEIFCGPTSLSYVDKKNQLDVTFCILYLLILAQHVSGNHVPIIRSWRLRDVIASCWYVPWLQWSCQVRLAGSASMDVFVALRAITSRRRQLLMMGTWLPETCWANIRREIKDKKWHLVGFSYPHWITMRRQPHIRSTVVISTQVTFHITARVGRCKAMNVHVFGLTAWNEVASCTPI